MTLNKFNWHFLNSTDTHLIQLPLSKFNWHSIQLKLTKFHWHSPNSTDTQYIPLTLTKFHRHSLNSTDTHQIPLTLNIFHWHSPNSTDTHQIPLTLTHTTIAIKETLHSAVSMPIGHLPLSVRILGCFLWNPAKTISSTWQTIEGEQSQAVNSFPYRSKQTAACSLLNPVAQAVKVPTGSHNNVLSPCRFTQRLNQSFSAASLAIGNGLGSLLWTATLLSSSRVYPKYFRSINRRYSTS